MSSRRDFLKQASLLSAGTGLFHTMPASIAKALAIDPAAGSTFLDAEHVVILMQENRSFDHTYGTLQGVRGYNDPRAITLPTKLPVWYQANRNGETFAPFRLDMKNTNATWMESLPHAWTDQVDARNGGKYDRWLDTKPSHIEQYRHMPLTLGCYTREDIPFYYSLADAFTVCDHNFCSSLTGTTPNRLYFWTGTIREKQEEQALARVWNSDADTNTLVSWTTFPERLEKNGISWRIYQNEITSGQPLKGKHEAWLGNFGDNAIEYFKQYNAGIPSDRLTGLEKNLNKRAFTTNSGDPDFHELETLRYEQDGTTRELMVPKGDIFFQFRQDVKSGRLPTVSWLVAPQEFSDHPSSAWYGAWYISEVMDILTANPEVWKKTIFILTYDENDGYFDHVPPFVAPHPHLNTTGKVSRGIDTRVEYVTSAAQQTSTPEDARISPIGLGYRVPMVVASPWSRGGFVNSQVFDHTSSLMFLEKFLSKKTGKKIREENISEWRRTVCGDLTSVFRPGDVDIIEKPMTLERNEFVELIHKAQFKNPPSQFVKLTEEQKGDALSGKKQFLPVQEKGIRNATPLPYELYAHGKINSGKFDIRFTSGNKLFGSASAGSPFQVYAPNRYKNEVNNSWAYAVKAGDSVEDSWNIDEFENGIYHLRVYGPNGFYREFRGTQQTPAIDVQLVYVTKSGQPGLNAVVQNASSKDQKIQLKDNSYKTGTREFTLPAGKMHTAIVDVSGSFGWYDFNIQPADGESFTFQFAGHVEGKGASKTDPLMGGIL